MPLISNWRNTPPCQASIAQRYWLKRSGALTSGLKKLGHVQITVLNESCTSLKEEDSIAIQIPVHTPIWVREIMMSIDNTPCIWARSITPLSAAQSVWKGIRQLQTRPLADMLYHDPSITRSMFECINIKQSTVLRHTHQRYFNTPLPTDYYARRSVFQRAKQPLMVTECFLPAFWLLLNKQINYRF